MFSFIFSASFWQLPGFAGLVALGSTGAPRENRVDARDGHRIRDVFFFWGDVNLFFDVSGKKDIS